ncbi:hypothetical protein AGMMS49949_00590 [Alphaproteobacteria bacterium]|nr:hypothetical protein AGMMS49949_00590 [Alphaproteobacteria bacterium]GHS95602.1 hypothetical protein AGMMS50296_0230 [Alphaproteobacteria bacterium]
MMLPFSVESFQKMIQEKEAAAAPQEAFDFSAPIALNTSQAQAARQLVAQNHFGVTLIDGVTGSGKTEVYLSVLSETLQKSSRKQALLLLPEIALTKASLLRFQKYFQTKPWIWHSNTTPAQKQKIWLAALSGAPCVVIGARSALFLPFSHLAMIIVDEEHDPSYKQNEQGTYQARDMAILRGKIEDVPVILASATPSLETVQNVKTHKYDCVLLPTRFSEAQLPHLHVVDMRLEQDFALLSQPLAQALSRALQRQEQALLFVNQRGYAPVSLCRKCGFKWQCPSCAVYLIEHKAAGHLLCHHCGYVQPLPFRCPQCESEKSRLVLGVGMERVLETVQKTFPKARCLCLSSDTLSSKKRWDQAMEDIHNNNVDILLGTQILAKGHHFPNLTTVGIIEADRNASGCDLRANERTFQLLQQVAGRAGREQKPGHVFLQTFAPESPLLQALCQNDRDPFYDYELADRQQHAMPPFKMLIALILSGRKETDVQREARRLAQTFPLATATLLGPAPAPLSKLRDTYRYRLLIKGDKGTALQNGIKAWAKSENPAVSLVVDVDPYDFL